MASRNRRYLLALAELFCAPLSASTHVVHAAPQRLSDKPAAGADPSEYAARRSTLRRVLPSGERVSPHLRHPHTTNPCIHFDTVCAPFAGSGSTLIAAEQTGRNCYCMELDPKYASVILRRYVEATGDAVGVTCQRDGQTLSYLGLVKQVDGVS